jgi:hypothetical protein
MSEVKITDAAVEAAARIMLAFERPNHPWDEWTDHGHGIWKRKARAALEAAAPYIEFPDTNSDEYWDSLPTLGAEEA